MELPESKSGNLMLLAELAWDDEEDPLAETACEDEKDPLASIDPPLIEAFRNPETRCLLITLEEKIQKFIPTCSKIIVFPTFHTRYLADITSMLARHYGLEPLSAESTKFCRTPHCMPLPTLSSIIPPFQPERKVKTLKEREKFFKDLGVIINPGRLSSISPVIPQSTSPVRSGMVIEGGQDPDSASALSSMLAPLSLESLPSPRPEAAKLPSPGVPLQNQDVVNFPHPMEDEEPNFNIRRPPQRRRLM